MDCKTENWTSQNNYDAKNVFSRPNKYWNAFCSLCLLSKFYPNRTTNLHCRCLVCLVFYGFSFLSTRQHAFVLGLTVPCWSSVPLRGHTASCLGEHLFDILDRCNWFLNRLLGRPGGGVATGFSRISNHKCKNGFSDFSVIKKQRLLLLANFQASNIRAFSLGVKWQQVS